MINDCGGELWVLAGDLGQPFAGCRRIMPFGPDRDAIRNDFPGRRGIRWLDGLIGYRNRPPYLSGCWLYRAHYRTIGCLRGRMLGRLQTINDRCSRTIDRFLGLTIGQSDRQQRTQSCRRT